MITTSIYYHISLPCQHKIKYFNLFSHIPPPFCLSLQKGVRHLRKWGSENGGQAPPAAKDPGTFLQRGLTPLLPLSRLAPTFKGVCPPRLCKSAWHLCPKGPDPFGTAYVHDVKKGICQRVYPEFRQAPPDIRLILYIL